MVLVMNALIGLMIWFLAAVSVQVAAEPTLHDALTLLREHKPEQAIKVLGDIRKAKSSKVSAEVVYLEAMAWLELKKWDTVSVIAENRLTRDLKWWSEYKNNPDRASADIASSLEKTPKVYLSLMWLAGEASSLKYAQERPNTSAEKLKPLRDKVQIHYDALSQSGFEATKVQKMMDRLSDADEYSEKSRYHRAWYIAAGYWSWLDKISLSKDAGTSDSKAVVLTPWLGLRWSSSNGFYDFSGGAGVGRGTAHVSFSNGSFDSSGKVLFVSAFGRALKKTSESGSGVGLEADFASRTIEASDSTGKERGSALGVILMGVGRLQFSKAYIDFKGGSYVQVPSAVWNIEIGYPIF